MSDQDLIDFCHLYGREIVAAKQAGDINAHNIVTYSLLIARDNNRNDEHWTIFRNAVYEWITAHGNKMQSERYS